jgi:hypothetical protein
MAIYKEFRLEKTFGSGQMFVCCTSARLSDYEVNELFLKALMRFVGHSIVTTTTQYEFEQVSVELLCNKLICDCYAGAYDKVVYRPGSFNKQKLFDFIPETYGNPHSTTLNYLNSEVGVYFTDGSFAVECVSKEICNRNYSRKGKTIGETWGNKIDLIQTVVIRTISEYFDQVFDRKLEIFNLK